MTNILSSGSEFASRYRDIPEVPDEFEIPTHTAQIRVSVANLLGGCFRGLSKGILPWKHSSVVINFSDRVQNPAYNPNNSWHRAVQLLNQQISEVLGPEAVKNSTIRTHFLQETGDMFPL